MKPLAFIPAVDDIMLRAWRIAAVVFCVMTAFYISTVQLNGSDFWLQAKVGELIVNNGSIPDTLLFPFTEIATEKFNAHEWLTSVLFHYLLSGLGEAGMAIFAGATGLAIFSVFCYLAHIRNGSFLPVSLLCGLIALFGENYRHVIRPELISLLLMGVFWISLEKFRISNSWIAAIFCLVLIILWTNVHASFVLGPTVIFLYALGIYIDDARKSHFAKLRPSQAVLRFSLLTLAASAACLLNPFGYELIQFAVGFGSSNELHKLPGEWMPTFSSLSYGVRGFWIGLFIWTIGLGVLLLKARQTSAVSFLLFIFFSALAFKAIRFPVYLGMVFSYVLSGYSYNFWCAQYIQVRLYASVCAFAILTLIVSIFFGNASRSSPYFDATKTKFSDQMVRTLNNPALHGNVLNSMELGPELIYRAYPRLKPASDVRLDSYGMDYLRFQEALFHDDRLLSEFVQRYDVRYVLANNLAFDNFQKLPNWQRQEWRIILRDSNAVLLQRTDIQ